MHNAAMNSTFVYLSNIENISFDQAWKAAGFSSNTEDYFSPDAAVLVDWVHGEATYIKAMNKENVITLSRLGMELSWKDLEPYKGTDVGSGLYVVQYDIDSEFYLQVVDGKTDGVPTSARLYARCTGASCDIRTEDVRCFISRNQDEALDNAICRAILDQNADGTLSYLSLESIPTESHDILAVEIVRGTPLSEQADHRMEITAYIQYVYNRYGYSDGEL